MKRVDTSEEILGTVIGDFNSRRGQVLGHGERGTAKVVDAHALLSILFGYVPGLRGLSRDRANATMHFARYTVAPPAVAQQIAKSEGRRSHESGSAIFVSTFDFAEQGRYDRLTIQAGANDVQLQSGWKAAHSARHVCADAHHAPKERQE